MESNNVHLQILSQGFKATMLVLVLCLLSCVTIDAQFNVMKFGAVGNGETDDSLAFLKAWDTLCESTDGSPSLLVPKGTYLLPPVEFKGPCKSPTVHIQLEGTIMAPEKQDWGHCADNWIAFSSIDNLRIDGTGGFDAQGGSWWGGSSYEETDMMITRKKFGFISLLDYCDKPSGIIFRRCVNLELRGIKSVNSIRNHFGITSCDGATISGLTIEAPGDSPNTDGIDISNSENLMITDSFIGTGDDCIAVNSGVKHLIVDNVFCGPGHGISIGSLGKDGSTQSVEDVIVQNCNFSNVQNGARIKTWEGGKGYVKGIRYINITLDNAGKPIIIDQRYCPEGDCNPSDHSSLEIRDVKFINFRGTSATKAAITLDCSGVGPGCMETMLENVNIVGSNGAKVHAICNNVHGQAIDTNPIVPCLN